MTNQRWICEYLRCLFEEQGVAVRIKVGNARGEFKRYGSKVALPLGYTTMGILTGLEILLRELEESDWKDILGTRPVWICQAALHLSNRYPGTPIDGHMPSRLTLNFWVSWEEPADA